MGDPVTPLDRKVTESLFGLSLRGTANLPGNESAQFLAEVSITRHLSPRFSSRNLMPLRHWTMFTMSKEIQTAGQLHVDPHTAGRIEIIFSINLGVAENTLSHDLICDFANAQVGQLFVAV